MTIRQKIQRDRSALLVIDVQERLAPAIANHEALVDRTIFLIQAALATDVPILFTEHYREGLGPTLPSLRNLAPQAPVIGKIHFDASSESEDLTSEISRLDRTQIVVAGCEAHVCVMQTTLGLLAEGLQVAFVADAIGARFALDKEMAQQRLMAAGALPCSAEMVAFEWLGRGDDPAFKTILPAIKGRTA